MSSVSQSITIAQAAISEFLQCGGGDRSDPAATVGDLLCDLMHLCERDGVDFDKCLATGRMHFEHEGGGGHAMDDIARDENDPEMERLYGKGGVLERHIAANARAMLAMG